MTDEQTTVEELIEGLVNHGGTASLDDYVYAGGDDGKDLVYFHNRYFGKRAMPSHKDECVCSHFIKYNYFIEHKITKKLFVIGSSCIKHHRDRTCTFCGTIHMNRKDNLCKSCRHNHVFINVTFADKDAAKRMGARWNPTVRMWWVHPSNTNAIATFGRFI